MALKEISMVSNETLNQVYDWLTKRNLSQAMTEMGIYLSGRQQSNDSHRLEAIRSDFDMMTDYWKRGYKDPQLSGLYTNLLRRMYVLYANAALGYAVGKSSFLSSTYTRLALTTRDWSVQSLKETLEAFVSDVALLELEPEHLRKAKRKGIYERHHELMLVWFDNVWLSPIWTDGQAEAMEEILLSPTIDSNDQQLLVSGITLACINFFDAAKFRTLLHLYQKSTDEYVRQRALVGWTLALNKDIPQRLYPDVIKEMEKVLEEQAVCEELLQLQQQLIFCIRAEEDHKTIQEEIMPELLKNSNFRITRDGLEEIEENPLDDILHPDAEDRRMEQLEESFQKMQTMQQQGSDIYFGGFSQMKRFPFFKDICNWFVPFYKDHPAIVELAERFSNNSLMLAIMNTGPFCNSDKYSFVMAFIQVMERLPKELRNMLEKGEATAAEMFQQETQDAAYIRRTYLQDLYRFYRLFPSRNEFRNPFAGNHCIFFGKPMFTKTHLEPYFTDMAAFLFKKKMYHFASVVLDNCSKARRDVRFYLMAGYLGLHTNYHFKDQELTPVSCYRQALELQPDNERALLGLARALFSQEQYEEALEAYHRLATLQPSKKSYLLNRAVCLIRMSRYTEALKDLYRLNYESPDDANVNRVLAWALTGDEKYEQAEKIYAQLLSEEKPRTEDLLNYGYCLWLNGQVDDAADCFHRYLKETELPASFILENEQQLLMERGITEPEMQMMLYLL